MKVKDFMKTDVVTVTKEEPLRKALSLMRDQHIRHLPVVEGRRLVGIVTDRDVRQATYPSDLVREKLHDEAVLDKTLVGNCMTSTPITIEPDRDIVDAAIMMRDRKIGALPVVVEGNLVGIISAEDLLEVLIKVLGDRKKYS